MYGCSVELCGTVVAANAVISLLSFESVNTWGVALQQVVDQKQVGHAQNCFEPLEGQLIRFLVMNVDYSIVKDSSAD